MRNRLLTITRGGIPYIKELRPITKSIAGAIVMQQLDFWFNTTPDGFYKFLEPCEHDKYRAGDSWCEEIGCTPDEFRAAFDKIGVRYRSKTEYAAAGDDKFGGFLYCSFFDKIKGETWYFRNHTLVDTLLDEISSREPVKAAPGKWKNPSTVDGKSQIPGLGTPDRRMEKASLLNGESQPESLAETTTENTQRRQQQQPTAPQPPPEPLPADVVALEAALLDSLLAQGVAPKVAKGLLKSYPHATIRQQLAWLPQRKCEDRAATLVESIKEGYGPPAAANKAVARPRPRAAAPPAPARTLEPSADSVEAMRAAVSEARQKMRGGQSSASANG